MRRKKCDQESHHRLGDTHRRLHFLDLISTYVVETHELYKIVSTRNHGLPPAEAPGHTRVKGYVYRGYLPERARNKFQKQDFATNHLRIMEELRCFETNVPLLFFLFFL